MHWFGSLQTTTKFGLSFGLMLTIIVTEMIIGFAAMTALWQANNALQQSTEIQRLAMTIGRNWEATRRLQRDFFLQSAIVGADEAYRVQAMASAGKIAEVIRDGATLKRMIAASATSEAMRERLPDLDLILATVSQYATAYQDATELELRLASRDAGLRTQLEGTSSHLSTLLTSAREHETLNALYYELRFLEEATQHTPDATAAVSARLRQSIEQSSLPRDRIEDALATLATYEQLAETIAQTETLIQEKLATLAGLGNSVEPNLVTLLAAVNTESGRARLQIEQTRQMAVQMLVGAVIAGVLLALAVAAVLHATVTRRITRLTEVARRLQSGDLAARSPLDSGDELGHLAATLNAMAAKLGLTIERMEIVRAASLDLASELDTETVMDRALAVATTLSNAEIGFVGLTEGDDLFLARAIGPLRSVQVGDPLPCDVDTLAGIVRAREGAGSLVPKPTAAAGTLLPADHTCVAIPLLSANRTIGVMVLAASRADAFAPDTLRFLELYATGAAVAIHNALMYEDAQQLAVKDTLTGLYNRRGLVQFGQHDITLAIQAGTSLAAIFLDIDNFKIFNDRYSYDVGDQVLRAIAAQVQRGVPDTSLICRYGGEEFVVLLPGLDVAGATELAETLRNSIAALHIPTEAGALRVTISLGVAAWQPDAGGGRPCSAAQVLTDIIARAGRMLHGAKEGGRNRVVAEETLPSATTR